MAPDKITLVFAGLSLPDTRPEETVKRVNEYLPLSPIIFIAGNETPDLPLTTVQLGAQDYLVKGEFDRKILLKTVQVAIERKKVSNDYRRLFDDNPVPMFIFNRETYGFIAVNRAALNLYGYTKEEFLKLTALDIRPDEEKERFTKLEKEWNGPHTNIGRSLHKKKDGTAFYVQFYVLDSVFAGRNARMAVIDDIDKKVGTEQALRNTEQQLENILESITDGFFMLNANWEFTYLNKTAVRILDTSGRGLLHKNVWAEFPAARHLKFFTHYHTVMQQRVSTHFEEYFPPLQLWVSVNAYPTADGMAVYFQDITEQKKITDKLYIDEQNIRAIINNTRDVIWSMDRNYGIISANVAFFERIAALTGKKPEELTVADFDPVLFKTWTDLLDRAFAGEAYKTVLEENYDGNVVYTEVSFNPIYNKNNEVIGAGCFSRDITQQRNMEQQIEDNERNLRALIDNTTDLIWSVDTDFNLISANQPYLDAVYEFTGKYSETGTPVLLAEFGDKLVNYWRGNYEHALKHGHFIAEDKMEINGEPVIREVSLDPIYDEEKQVAGVSCFSRNVTEQRAHGVRIEAQNKVLNEIAWTQSHKIRNHVATIMGLTQLFDKTNVNSAENERIIEGIDKSSHELDRIIRQVNEQIQSLQ